MTARIDVLGIGNAIVDILCLAQDSDLEDMQLIKGMMTLVDDETAVHLAKTANVNSMQSGGSVANSMVHLSSLGGHCQYIGKIARDEIGDQFSQDMAISGIQYQTSPFDSGSLTGRCYVFITPDAQRTMCTYLGACAMLSTDDTDQDAIKQASYVLIEGYLWDSQSAKNLIMDTARIAKNSGTKIAFTLSDPMLVCRHRKELQDFVEQKVDLLFANELEAEQLYESEGLQNTLQVLKQKVSHLIVTRGESGSVVILDGEIYSRDADKVKKVVDTTGAGDAYAAGYLYGLTQNWQVERCMEVASAIAAHTVTHLGGRLDAGVEIQAT